jgi:BON domain-containing protein
MPQRWQRLLLAACMIGSALASGCARGGDHSPVRAARARTTPTPPGVSAAKSTSKAAKPGSLPTTGMIPGDITRHRPPVPPPSSHHNSFEVPQPKTLADTPDMVLNSRVRASLMSALAARNTQDLFPQTAKGVVTLTGTVKSQALRARAEQVARGVHGVRAVKNRLTVK